jgi:hypothetical protein
MAIIRGCWSIADLGSSYQYYNCAAKLSKP